MDSTITPAQWCQQDKHSDYERFTDFNDWIDSREGSASGLLQDIRNSNLSHPSKAFYAGDREAYEQAFDAYQLEQTHDALSRDALIETLGEEDGLHWYERNEQHLDQLIERITNEAIVPFIGAGASAGGGFPTWENHLRQQGRTAGHDPETLEAMLNAGEHEAVIELIEKEPGGTEIFTQEIRDVFGRTGTLTDITLRISELFKDTLITTNYDQLIEQAFDDGSQHRVQVINSTAAMDRPDATATTLYKLHGDAKSSPSQCILGKSHYDAAYGPDEVDTSKPIPKLLSYHYKNSSLLFLGCSLNNDRTLQVFQTVKAAGTNLDLPQHFAIIQAPTATKALVTRNRELAALGITAIWYAENAHEKVEMILRYAHNKLQQNS